jgi:uncharacterized protein (TIGR03118 family)
VSTQTVALLPTLKKLVIFAFAAAGCLPAVAQAYKVTNIVSDGSVPATTMDANFINPWAISFSPTWWIAAQGTGYDYVVSSTGTIPFKVIVPSAANATAAGFPAGSVTVAGASGMILPNGTKASFVFSTLDGTISGWNSKLGTANAMCQIMVNNSAAGASYPGLAVLTTSSTNSYLLAANFGTGNAIEVYDNTFKPTKLAGNFTDPSLPAGYAPFAVHVLGSQVFVSYALRTTAAPFSTVTGSGNGVVNIFDTSGNFVARAVTGGNLNAPWGVAFAPANFGIFSNDLLIGNFGDGMINVYDPKTFAYLGQLVDTTGKPLVYASLWELLTGGTAVAGTTSVSGGDTSTVYFTAGLTNETHGLFAGITNSTTSGSTPTFGFSSGSGAVSVNAGAAVQFPISVAPVNGFSGSVSLACTGLPARTTCFFTPTQLTVSSTASAVGTVMIQTTKPQASLRPRYLRGTYDAGIASAVLLPFASILAIRRRRSGKAVYSLRLLGAAFAFFVVTGLIAGCSNYMPPASTALPGTPSGQSNIVITATSGAITQQTTVALTVQ